MLLPMDDQKKTKSQGYQFRFENLDVWRLSRRLNNAIYRISKRFPEEENSGLRQQMRRASLSVSSYIAEGAGQHDDTEFSHFLRLAYGSLMDLVSLMYLALDQDFLDQQSLDRFLELANELAAKTMALSKSLGRKPRQGTANEED